MKKTLVSGTAEHRPAVRRRRFRHDDLVAVDLFSGFGGLTRGIEQAGFTTIMAANHNRYKIDVHEANHPAAEHWIADLVDPGSADYHSARDLPAADLLVAGISCVNHSLANTRKAYEGGLSLFDLEDPDFEARVTRSERDRATANCVLHYAATHHPRMILIECTTELASWGPSLPGKPRIGDGSTYRWWLRQFDNEGYAHRVLYLNSMFFGVPQSRDRLYIAFWDRRLPAPDLDHRPVARCTHCDRDVESVWTWRTGVPPTGSVRYGKQYEYRCPSCRRAVSPPTTPSLAALDLSNLGTRIGDRAKPLAPATMARAERCRQRFAEFPPVLIPASTFEGNTTHPWNLATSGHRAAGVVSTGAIMGAAGNTFEREGSTCRTRSVSEPLWSQTATNSVGVLTPPHARTVNSPGSGRTLTDAADSIAVRGMPNRTNATSRAAHEPMETLVAGAGSGGLAVLSSGVIPFRRNTIPTTHHESMPTVTADQIPGLLTAAGTIKNNGAIGEARYRAHPVSDPLGTIVGSAASQAMLFSGWTDAPAPHAWSAALDALTLDECYFRMMAAHEVGRGCGFDVDFAGYRGSFLVWGSARNQCDGFGNAVSPQVGEWIGHRLRAALHSDVGTGDAA